ncbi:GNAT family N-acetyltransferase [Halocynthiibacter sp. C4]|uniref:GNAT family N-acetyltransferase n=1 Tax=Halocynthiibacter sp. C4 TaxID=2992758 RepID=UPI00237B189C|nr:GNAT family N-acetyltransferase [Halocynthiibacter sp. C4]MDE0588456.1 GNAT family N-acetyltransferase [Halocynthiibacter sp. C4]
MAVELLKVRSAEDVEHAQELVWEFFDVLRHRYPEMINDIDAYIKDQNVAESLDDFLTWFSPPVGECFLARADGQPAGIVMLKDLKDGSAEMNRMYVRKNVRGLGVGRKLCVAAINGAKDLGFKTLRLDALHRHVEALPLYESVGFVRYHDADAVGGDDARFIHMKMPL